MRLPQADDAPTRAALAALLLAAAELLGGALIAGVAAPDRAEALSAILLRPWIVVLLGLVVVRAPAASRLAAYALFLLAAGAAEALYARLLGNAEPWAEMARGWLAGALLLVPIDIVLQLARRRFGRRGVAAVAIAAILLFAVPQVLQPYRAVADPADRPAADAPKPPLLLMTALPIIWGEGGAFDPGSRPAESYRLLQEEFSVQPIDTIDPASLGAARLLLLAQPRWLAPVELVALDRWVRAGGRLLILTDPLLEWPSELPLGDVRRAPPVGLLAPLLDHWGLALGVDRQAAVAVERAGRLLAMRRPGRFAAAADSPCRTSGRHFASCRIGKGKAMLIADADLMRDDLWLAGGEGGGARSRRRADNPLVVADLLDSLAGLERSRTRARVAWVEAGADRRRALGLAVLPIALAAAATAAFRLRRRRAAR